MSFYKPNAGFEAEWLASTDALDLVQSIADAAAPIAQDLAAQLTGNLADGILAEAAVLDGVATGRVVSTDFKGSWLEFGTRRADSGGRAQPYLRPAMEAATGVSLSGGRS